MDLPILYTWHTDIVFHVLTHMKVGNASNIFNRAYVEEIRKEKERLGIQDGLIGELENLTDYYMKHFESLTIINFIPFMVNDFEELIQTIAHWSTFTEEDRRNFINDFLAILENEKVFYRQYWQEKDNGLKCRKTVIEKSLNDRFALFQCLFNYYKQHKHMEVKILLSYSMGQNGRGMGIHDAQIVAVPFPIDEKSETDTFFMVLHELTHPCTDYLVGDYISMGDGSHALTENIVMIADYEIIKKVSPTLIEDYFKWICNKSGNPNVNLDEDTFYNSFAIPLGIKDALEECIREIVCLAN